MPIEKIAPGRDLFTDCGVTCLGFPRQVKKAPSPLRHTFEITVYSEDPLWVRDSRLKRRQLDFHPADALY
jgi:hypothetical protein